MGFVMASAATIRPGLPADWPTIADLLTRSKLPVEGAQECLQHFVVAEEASEVVGCAALEPHGQHALLRSVAVSQQHRHRGLAGAMIEHRVDSARRLGLGELHLLTTTASPYFARMGFAAVARSMVPADLDASAEFQGACPASAVLMRLDLRIRAATPRDAEAVAAIYAPIVSSTAISFELDPPSADEMRRRIEATLPALPWLVSVDAHGEVDGYAYASRHRERAAYQWSVDCTAYVREDCRGRGVGRRLYSHLLATLKGLGYHQAFAGIALPNAASVALHTAMGFEPVGTFREVGFKLDAWRDVSWWQCQLQRNEAPLRTPRSLA